MLVVLIIHICTVETFYKDTTGTSEMRRQRTYIVFYSRMYALLIFNLIIREPKQTLNCKFVIVTYSLHSFFFFFLLFYFIALFY